VQLASRFTSSLWLAFCVFQSDYPGKGLRVRGYHRWQGTTWKGQ